MVRDSIYAFMEYLDTPLEVEISFKYTIPQHQDLDIPLKYVVAMMQAVANVACAATPEASKAPTQKSWDEMMQSFAQLIYSFE